MHLKKSPVKDGRTYLSIVESRREPKTGKPQKVTIQKLGYLEDLAKEHSDPIGHCTGIVAEMNRAKAADHAPFGVFTLACAWLKKESLR